MEFTRLFSPPMIRLRGNFVFDAIALTLDKQHKLSRNFLHIFRVNLAIILGLFIWDVCDFAYPFSRALFGPNFSDKLFLKMPIWNSFHFYVIINLHK